MYACTHITHKTHTHTHYPSWVSFTGITTSSSPTPRRHHLKTVSVSHHRCYWLYSKGPFDFRRNQVATNSLYVVLRETSVGIPTHMNRRLEKPRVAPRFEKPRVGARLLLQLCTLCQNIKPVPNTGPHLLRHGRAGQTCSQTFQHTQGGTGIANESVQDCKDLCKQPATGQAAASEAHRVIVSDHLSLIGY